MEKAKLTLKCVTRIFSWMLFRLFTATRGSERRSCWAPAMVDAMLHTLDSCMELSPLLKKKRKKSYGFHFKRNAVRHRSAFYCCLYRDGDMYILPITGNKIKK